MADGDLTTLPILKGYLDLTASWVKSTTYSVKDKVQANGNLYECITGGASASSGGGPSGTTTDITDGAAHWKYTMAASTADTILTRLITAVSTRFAALCDRTFAETDWILTTQGHGTLSVVLPEWPVSEVTSVVVGGTTVPQRSSVGTWGWAQVADNEIRIDGSSPFFAFKCGVGNVVVTFTAGYDTIPYDLEQACIETCASWYKRKQRVDENSKTLGNETLTFSTDPIPKSALATLQAYRRTFPREGYCVEVTTP
jgi:hypothetical protein